MSSNCFPVIPILGAAAAGDGGSVLTRSIGELQLEVVGVGRSQLCGPLLLLLLLLLPLLFVIHCPRDS